MIFLVLLPFAVLTAGIVYQAVQTARDRGRYPAPGRLVEVNGQKLHINVQGQGTPPVVLESGIGASSLSWSAVQPRLAQFTQTVTYDRAGLGWSSGPNGPRTVSTMVGELREMLRAAGVPPPYILVGHSFGALLVRAYAALYANEVAGLVLVDPVGISTWADCSNADLRRINLGVRLAKRGAWLAHTGLVRAALATLVAGRTWFPKLAARTGGRKGTAAMAHLIAEVRKLPPQLWPMVRSHWSNPKCFGALAAYLGCLPASARHVQSLQLPSIATVVLSASTATQKELDERDYWISEHPRSRHIRVPDSGHWLHLEQPDVVVHTVAGLMEALGKDS